MHRRTLLRAQFNKAWHATVEAYNQGLVNSESALQLQFCTNLVEIFSEQEKMRKLLIQPSIRIGEKLVYPDLLVCLGDSVIGALELKFNPLCRPEKQGINKDLKTLRYLKSSDEKLRVEQHRHLGPTPKLSYTVAPDAVLCWGGLYKSSKNVKLKDLDQDLVNDIGQNFMRMDALTHPDRVPTIIAGRPRD